MQGDGRTPPGLPVRSLLLFALFFGLVARIQAGTFSSDFNSSRIYGAEVRGDAAMEPSGGIMNSGSLRLTESHPKEQGALVIDELDPGRKVTAFNVRFRMAMGNGEGPIINQGVSVSFAPELPAIPGLDGSSNGFVVSFTPYISSKGLAIPSVRIRYNGTNVASPYFALRTDTNFVDVQIQLDADGALTVSYNGATAYDHSKLFDFEPFAGRFAIAAQTGSSSESHVIDDLWITTETSENTKTRTKSRRTTNPKLLSEYSVRAWHVEDGLPQNMIQALVQDEDGYLWAGTRKGIARFDGIRFTIFDSENTPALKDSSVNALCASKEGGVWVGTEDGLVKIASGKFTRFVDGLPSEKVKAVYETRDGSVLVGTMKGPARFRNGKFESLPHFTAKPEVVRSVFEDRSGNTWIGMGAEIHRISATNGNVNSYNSVNGTSINLIRAIFQDSHGDMWFASNLGLNMLKDEKWTRYSQKSGLGHSVVSWICEDNSGNLWVGNYGGLSRMEGGKLRIEFNSNGEPFDVVNTVLQDKEGDIWLAAKDGLYQLRARRVEVYTRQQGLSYHNVTSIMEDHSGTIWMATWGGGLNQLKDGRFTSYSSKNSMASDLLLSLCEDHEGSLWVGTDYGGGIYHRTNGMFKYHGTEKGIVNAAIRVIYQDSRTNLWLGTAAGLQLYTFDDAKLYTRSNGLAGDNVRVIFEDHSRNLWIGTTSGLSRKTNDTFVKLTTKQGLSDNGVLSICEDAQQNLWIGTEGGNLNRMRNGKITTYTKRNGLLTEEIFEILDDDLGNLWLSSLNGITRVSKKSLDDFDRGIVTNISCILYGKDDGMVSIQCNGVSKPSAWKSKDGRLWFATTKGAAIIDPRASLNRNDQKPLVLIEEFIFDKQPIATDNARLRLPPGRGELEFHYTSLSLQIPEKNRFKYKLEGVDSDWVDAGSRRVAYYNNIGPGQHIFRVIASNNDGVWNETGASLNFYLAPHFYETTWFYSAVLLFIGGAIVGVYRLNVRRLQKRQKVLEDLVEDRTKHLKHEIVERQRVQAQLIEVSRKAGMAEVASGVLHNVGNVLNSVNVSATLAMDRMRSSRHANLEKASTMLREHANDLGTFLKEDPKGKQLPDYLAKLSSRLSQDHEESIKDLAALCKNIDHIKDIVSMQQAYAKISGVVESLKASEIVEDALRMNDSSLTRHQMHVRRDYVDDPVITVDKHKVLQILVNLFQNAKEACECSDKPTKELTIRTQCKDSVVRILVTDNGVGIPSENLTKIFSHGFTTRPNGHGFGLHNSALGAKELGGCLSAHSDGSNRGATFILEIPLQQSTKQTNGATIHSLAQAKI